jgi:hypothetical protein
MQSVTGGVRDQHRGIEALQYVEQMRFVSVVDAMAGSSGL